MRADKALLETDFQIHLPISNQTRPFGAKFDSKLRAVAGVDSSMASEQNPDEVLPYIARVNTQLAGEVRQLREGTCHKLYKQTRSFIDALQRSPLGQNTTYGPSVCTISEVSIADTY